MSGATSGSPHTFRSRRTLLPGRPEPTPASVHVRDGVIEAVKGYEEAGPALIDLGDLVLMAGLVDTHVHVNEPGRTEWEGFRTATAAAAAGGITTLVDMPLNSIPATTTLAALGIKREAAQGSAAIDYGFWGGVVPGNSGELEGMVEAGVLGFKAFLIDSGVEEFPLATERDLRQAMPILARLGVPLLVHAELAAHDALQTSPPGSPSSRKYESYLASRPPAWEVDAIRLMIRLAEETRCRVHIVHLSAAEALADLRSAKARGIPITAETCPHYLHFAAEEIPDGATPFKCAPPIRGRENREKLWAGLAENVIDFVVSDHSPCTPALKALEAGDFARAWGGISGLQFGLPILWTGMRARGLGLGRLSEWVSARTAKFIGNEGRKGAIAPGCDADLVAWDPERTFVLSPEMIRHRHRLTPYAGGTFHGAVERTFVRGALVDPASPARHGLPIRRHPA